MTQVYSDPSRETETYALPNIEVFWHAGQDSQETDDFAGPVEQGWYWWPCFPGCLPDGDPVGPFATEAEAIADAQDID